MSHDSSPPSLHAQEAGHDHAQSTRALLLMLAPATVAAAPLAVFGKMTSLPWMLVALIALTLAVTGLLHRVDRVWTRMLASLPLSSSSSEALSWIDAAFTAVSATCVTGLIVVDTPSAFSGFGQLVVLLLIQIGGLGIMVFSAAAIVLLGKRLSLSHERAAANIVGVTSEERALDTRRLLIWLLDREERPIVVLNDRDERVCMNRASLSDEVPLAQNHDDDWSAQEIPDTSLRLMTYQGETAAAQEG